MKLLVISDIHGSLHYASQIPLIWERENPDKLVLLGDLYYHGPRNPLTEEYKPMKVAEILNEFKDSLIAIRGNCDAEVDQMISDFPLQDYVKEEINGKIIYFTHGHHYNLDHLPEEKIDNLWSCAYRIYKRRKWNYYCKSWFYFLAKKRYCTQLFNHRAK